MEDNVINIPISEYEKVEVMDYIQILKNTFSVGRKEVEEHRL